MEKKEAELMKGAEMIQEKSREIEETYAVSSSGYFCSSLGVMVPLLLYFCLYSLGARTVILTRLFLVVPTEMKLLPSISYVCNNRIINLIIS